MNVIQKVVEKGWCIGCGMCAAVCPKNRLEIHWNKRGEYNPVEVDRCADCPEGCSLCYQVCPTHGKTKNETDIGQEWYGSVNGIQHTDETGYYLSAYVGYSDKNDHQKNGASGGIATWTLETLLETGAIDTVAAVGHTTDPDKLFEFKICKTSEDIRACSRSAYYPVETSQVIRHILHNDGTYAIIGLPCVCKAIRLAQDKFPKLKQRIKYVLGLTCGHQCSKFFAEYICALGGGNPHELKEFIFRKKDLTQPAYNLAMYFRSGKGKDVVSRQVLWNDGVGFAYVNGYFQLPSCFYCDDVFGECADVTFMDAWLPEYKNKKQTEGHNLVLVRDLRIDVYIQKAIRNDLPIAQLPVEKVIKSQHVVLDRKRRRNSDPSTSPVLRSRLHKHPIILQPELMAVQKVISKTSSLQWNSSAKDFSDFSEAMFPLRKQLEKYQKRQRLLRLPDRIYGRIKRILKDR